MRVFVAVDVGDAVRREVTRVVSTLTGKLEAVKTPPKVVWVKPAALHVTVRFLGEIEPADVERLQEVLAPPIPIAPFEIEWRGIGTFPSNKHPRALWIGVVERRRAAGAARSGGVAAAGRRQRRRPRRPRVTPAPYARPREDGRRRRRLAEDPAGGRGQARQSHRRPRDAVSQRIVAAGAALYWIGERAVNRTPHR